MGGVEKLGRRKVMDIFNSWGKGLYLGINIFSVWYFALVIDTVEVRYFFKKIFVFVVGW